jgi:hypothetical protein
LGQVLIAAMHRTNEKQAQKNAAMFRGVFLAAPSGSNCLIPEAPG